MSPHEFLAGMSVVLIPLAVFATLVARYALIAGGAMAILVLFRKQVDPARLQPVPITTAQIFRELCWSLSTLMIFAVLLTGLIALNQSWAIFKVYPEFGQYGVVWEFIALAILFFGHDAYFYAAHRLMHAPGVYDRVHKVHHLSTNPTPLSAFSFHPVEAFVELAGVIVLICIGPISAPMVALFSLIALALNVIGHLGVEIYPRRWLTHPVLKYLNSPTVHNHHHRTFRGNYGLYTLVWDHVFGTLNPPKSLGTAYSPTRPGLQAEN